MNPGQRLGHGDAGRHRPRPRQPARDARAQPRLAAVSASTAPRTSARSAPPRATAACASCATTSRSSTSSCPSARPSSSSLRGLSRGSRPCIGSAARPPRRSSWRSRWLSCCPPALAAIGAVRRPSAAAMHRRGTTRSTARTARGRPLPVLPEVTRHAFGGLADNYLLTGDEDWFKVDLRRRAADHRERPAPRRPGRLLPRRVRLDRQASATRRRPRSRARPIRRGPPTSSAGPRSRAGGCRG